MKKLFLNENWYLFNERIGSLSATVPGCVHTDLQKHGIIPDYFWRDNNDQCKWVENEDWTYSCTFDCPSYNQKNILHFDGLDTYATIKLNGETLGETHNMFIPHSFDVSGKLKEKGNLLEVCFRSPVKEVAGKPPLPAAFTNERLYTRRMQCTYSWDWVDRFVTCGIFLPVYLEIGENFHVESTYIYTESIDAYGAQIRIVTDFANHLKTGVVAFEILSPTGESVYKHTQYVAEPQVAFRVNLTKPELWWPNGYGEHPLYTLRIRVNEEDYTEKFGVRTLRIAEIIDEKGGKLDLLAQHYKALQKEVVAEELCDHTEDTAAFCVIVNGKRIFCRGGNWVPCSPFPSEESEDKIKNLITLAVEGNMNMLRVWGGGWFEKDVFYEECDRNGVLVAQDFLMACGDYPQTEEWFLDELKRKPLSPQKNCAIILVLLGGRVTMRTVRLATTLNPLTTDVRHLWLVRSRKSARLTLQELSSAAPPTAERPICRSHAVRRIPPTFSGKCSNTSYSPIVPLTKSISNISWRV